MSTANPTPSAYCRMCGRALAENEVRDVRGAIYCEPCIAAKLEGAAARDNFDKAASHVEGAVRGAAKVTDAAVRAATDAPPSPGLATFLGFIPGAGAMYNGQFMKAFAHIFIFAMLVAAANAINEVFGVFVAAFIAYMVIDAHKTAKSRLQGEPLPDYLGLNSFFGRDVTNIPASAAASTTASTDPASVGQGVVPPNVPMAVTDRPPVGAIVLIGLGVLFLIRNFLDIRFEFFNYIWPLFIVAVGFWVAVRRLECRSTVYLGSMMGPAIIITIGLLLFFNQFHYYGRFWHNLWPILLIVIGGIRLMGSTVIKHSPDSSASGDDSTQNATNQ